MYEGYYLDYEGSTIINLGEPSITRKVELRADDTRDPFNVGTVYTEKHTFKNFLETEYVTSDGITVKNQILSDGKRISEKYDSALGEYKCSIFDNNGTLLSRELINSSGKYIYSERQADGTMSEKSGYSIFVRYFEGKPI